MAILKYQLTLAFSFVFLCIFREQGQVEPILFPCNQFLSQEPGDADEIKQFAKQVKGITFDGIMAKVDVNGPNAHPMWTWLKNQQKGWFGDDIKWVRNTLHEKLS